MRAWINVNKAALHASYLKIKPQGHVQIQTLNIENKFMKELTIYSELFLIHYVRVAFIKRNCAERISEGSLISTNVL